ncbi:hypothetical protein QTP88_019138 [Uroleucon formosanum]
MSSDEEDVAIPNLWFLLREIEQEENKKKIWVHPLNLKRTKNNTIKCFIHELRNDEFCLGATKIGLITNEVCTAIWKLLSPIYLPMPREEDWIKISNEFNKIWIFPNCTGSIDEYPFVFIGDEAYSLLPCLMRPFPRRNLTNEKRIFNYRQSRARRIVEYAFGIMVKKFKVLENKIVVLYPDKINTLFNFSTPSLLTGTLQNQIDYSNEKNSFDNTSSDDSDYNNSNSNSTDTLSKDDYISIPDFNFDTTTSGIKLNIEDTARHSQLKYLIKFGLKKLLTLL